MEIIYTVVDGGERKMSRAAVQGEACWQMMERSRQV